VTNDHPSAPASARASASSSPSATQRPLQQQQQQQQQSSAGKRKGKGKKSTAFSFTASPRAAYRSPPTPARLVAELRAIVSATTVTPEQRAAGDRIAASVYHYKLPVQCAIM